MMLLNHDPTFLMRDLIVFIILALIIFIGFAYILKNYEKDRIIRDHSKSGAE